MPTTRKRARRGRKVEIADWMVLYLLHGMVRPDGSRSIAPLLYRREYDGCFAGEPAAALWREQREDLLASWVQERPGTRPWGWWVYDAPEDRPAGESEAAYLRRHNLLAPGEMEESHEV